MAEPAAHDVCVSVLSAVFNEERHIAEMIESVQAQTHSNFELIFVDDGSVDSTGAIIRSYSRADSRIRYLRPEAKPGKVGAFNIAFANSSGQLIVLLGGDDTLPADSLATRVEPFVSGGSDPAKSVSSLQAKLRTFSADPTRDGLILPKGAGASRSGGVIALTRPLAEMLFPVPTSLVSEDIWLGTLSHELSDEVHVIDKVVLNYRIHEGNSNPRALPFKRMSEAMHQRLGVYRILAESTGLGLAESARARFARLAALEDARHRGAVWRILTMPRTSLKARARALSASHPALFALRIRFFRTFSGW